MKAIATYVPFPSTGGRELHWGRWPTCGTPEQVSATTPGASCLGTEGASGSSWEGDPLFCVLLPAGQCPGYRCTCSAPRRFPNYQRVEPVGGGSTPDHRGRVRLQKAGEQRDPPGAVGTPPGHCYITLHLYMAGGDSIPGFGLPAESPEPVPSYIT